jgi:hypothetical protein
MTMTPTVTFEEASLGEAMRALSPPMRAWVFHKVQLGCSNLRAAELAGYSGTPEVLKVTGHRIAHDPRVQAAMTEEAKKVLRSEGGRSLKVLCEIRDNPQAENKDRLKAAIEIMNRAGLNAIAESHLTVEHRLSESEQDRRILALAAELGMSETEAKKLLIAPADMERNAQGVYSLPEEPAPEVSEEERQRWDRHNATKRQRRAMTPEEAAADKEAVRAEQSERQRQEYAAAQVTDAEFEEIGDPLADLADVL